MRLFKLTHQLFVTHGLALAFLLGSQITYAADPLQSCTTRSTATSIAFGSVNLASINQGAPPTRSVDVTITCSEAITFNAIMLQGPIRGTNQFKLSSDSTLPLEVCVKSLLSGACMPISNNTNILPVFARSNNLTPRLGQPFTLHFEFSLPAWHPLLTATQSNLPQFGAIQGEFNVLVTPAS